MCIFSINFLDILFKASTVLIALFNLLFAIIIFYSKTKKDDVEKEKDRNIQLLKTFVLDNNLKYFYEYFERIDEILIQLKKTDINDNDKSKIDGQLQDEMIILMRKFIDLFTAIDNNLYNKIKELIDNFQSHLSVSIFDKGINLTHQPKYDEIIYEKVSQTKIDVIRILFEYIG